MEEEAEKLKQLQSEVDKQMNMGSPPGISKFANLHFSARWWDIHGMDKIKYYMVIMIVIIYIIQFF